VLNLQRKIHDTSLGNGASEKGEEKKESDLIKRESLCEMDPLSRESGGARDSDEFSAVGRGSDG
jgi:hypothetical protein